MNGAMDTLPTTEGVAAARGAIRSGHAEAVGHLRAETPEAPDTAPEDFTPDRTPGQGNC